MATSKELLDQLLKALSGSGYTAWSDEELAAEASRQVQSGYDQKRLSAQNAYEEQDQALEREIAALAGDYDRQRAQSGADYANAYAAAGRESLRRGMQRSSYAAQSMNNLLSAGAQAQQTLNSEQSQREGGLRDQQTLAATQLARQLAGYDAQQQTDVQAALDSLREREQQQVRDAQSAQTALLLQIYQLQHAREAEQLKQQNRMTELALKYNRSGGSGTGGTSAGSTASSKRTATRHYPAQG